MNKLTFPKGSLKFKKISKTKEGIEKTDEWKNTLKFHTMRKKYADMYEKLFPEALGEEYIPGEIINSGAKVAEKMRETRKQLKQLPSFSSSNNYEIIFNHPKWSKVIGEIKLQSERSSFKDSLLKIAKQFKEMKDNHRKIRMREKIQEVKSFKTQIKYNVSGGCIYMPEVKEGVYLKFIKDQEKRIVFSDKVPKDKANYVGVELEFMCDWDQEKLGFALFDAGVGKQVTVTDDGSLRCCENRKPNACDKHKGKHLHEVCILVKENNYHEVIKRVCNVLAKANAVVNKSCGMHVHLDMRNRDAEKAYQNLISSQNILFKMNPKSRSEFYAKKVTNRDFEAMKNVPHSGLAYRYWGINAVAMQIHTTIEIRIHSGTIDYKKITNWIELLLLVTNNKERIEKNFISLKLFSEAFKIPKELKSYILERIEKFNPTKDANIAPEQGAA